MNAKKVLLLGIICVFLAGCNNGKPLEMKGEEISTEERDTRREELTGEESRSNSAQGTGSIGARLEGCYDDPNNPVKDQNYDVGQPIYE